MSESDGYTTDESQGVEDEEGFDSCQASEGAAQEVYPEYNQFAQITTHFPIAWRNTYNTGTGGIDINLSKEQIQFVFQMLI